LESAAQHSSIELIIRETASQGRLDAAEVARLVARFPTADWYLCGPESYRREIREWLKQAHVAGDRIHTETFTSIGPPDASREEREAFTRYVLVQPQAAPGKPFREMLRRTGKILHSFANTRINPLRGVEKRLARMTGLDASLPLEYLAMVSALSWGPHGYQLQAFSRLNAGDTFTYWMPASPMPKYPAAYRVDSGWTKIAERRLVPVYVTRSRSAIEYLLRRPDDTDRGALPYHYFQQVLGRPDIPSCPGRKAAGLFAGPLHDNATWTEDRALTSDAFGFRTIDLFGPGMAAAADQTCASIDEVIKRDPNAVIDLNVMLSKVAYTIIVLSVFGNVDLVEMHALGRTLAESIRKQLDYLWEFVMGRQSVPADYLPVLAGGRKGIKRIIDLLRELDQRGKLTESQRSAPVVRMVLETANEPDGAYDRLTTLVLPIIIGGHETTGHAMTWAFYEMARNAELEARVLAEIETFRAARGARPISTADYDERPMTWALLAECLRRYPPVSSLSRTTLRDGTVPPDPKTGAGGFHFPTGAMIVFSFIGIHLDPARWKDPYAFQPKRWFEGVPDAAPLREKGRMVRANIRAREQALDWLPFSDGPGRCPGQHFNAHEFFVILDALLPRYRFELANPKEDVSLSESLIVGPAQGRMAVRIRQRS
jgi:cytochrome P450